MNKRNKIKTIMRTMYDFQDMRVRMGNRLKKKKNGDNQKVIEELNLDSESIPVIVDVWQDTEEAEKKLAKQLKEEIKEIPVYEIFLKNVKGIGPLIAAVIISEFDIHKANTVSKLWQYSGLNPGQVKGTKSKGSKKDGTYETYKTEQTVKGDRLTAGYLSPFNIFLRTKLVGVLATSFIKCGSPYREYYDNYKHRLENEKKTVEGGEKAWCEETKAHRNNAAKRYMIKMFLKDLYVAWRTIEGLEVRAPYQEQYLNHKH